MNKEQLLEEVRSGKLAIENDTTFKDNTLDELRECLNIIWTKDDFVAQGTQYYYFQDKKESEYFMSKTIKVPTIKVREALQILKQPNLELKIESLEHKFEQITNKTQAAVEPECPYKEGELILVKDEYTEWHLLISTGKIKNGKAETYIHQEPENYHDKITWKFHASTNGLKLPE